MSNLIITIIGIALVAVTALLGIVFLAPAIDNYIASTYTSQIRGDIQQIDATIQLMIANGTSFVAGNQTSLVTAQMSNAPQPPKNIIVAPYNQNYGVSFRTSPKRGYLIYYQLQYGSFTDGNGVAYDFANGGSLTTNYKNLGARICKMFLQQSPTVNPNGGAMNTASRYVLLGSDQMDLSCWQSGGDNNDYIALFRVY